MAHEMPQAKHQRNHRDEHTEDRNPADDTRSLDEIAEKIAAEIFKTAVGDDSGRSERNCLRAGIGPDHDGISVPQEMLTTGRPTLGPVVGLPGRIDPGDD